MTETEKIIVGVMLTTAVLGTIWYLYLELKTNANDLSAVGWSIVVMVWFVVLRRVFYLWRRGNNDS